MEGRTGETILLIFICFLKFEKILFTELQNFSLLTNHNFPTNDNHEKVTHEKLKRHFNDLSCDVFSPH